MNFTAHTIPSKSVSANLGRSFLCGMLFCCAFLTACTVGPWEKAFWSPPSATGVAPIESGPTYPIERLNGTASQWPNLGEMPPKPDKPQTEVEQAAAIQTLANERDQALQKAKQAQSSKQTQESLSTLPATPPTIPPEIEFAP